MTDAGQARPATPDPNDPPPTPHATSDSTSDDAPGTASGAVAGGASGGVAGGAAGGVGDGGRGGERGRTVIRDRVVARIVAEAAAEVDESGGLTRTVLGVPVPGRGPVRTEVRVHGDVVTARVAMSVPYPLPVREVARRVRESVRGRVAELTGFTVRQVDIDVDELGRPAAGDRTLL
ncbi:Asp23/Gls24 family envelope stress response protein [Actinomadura sp. 9N215]|uniref:Asp23/Gls24 family envelope stress response protein n=1 Tax=Actinomadura sp. 9N215 TaxID=3375150 RepID=UPI0037BBFC08